MLGTCQTDLAYIYNETINSIAYLSVAMLSGYILGALMIGPLYLWLNRQIVQIFSAIIMTITISLTPFYNTLILSLAGMLLYGIGSGSWDASSGFWMIEMWPIGNEAMLQLMQFTYGAGSVVAPLLSAPYVHGDDDDDDNAVEGLLTKQPKNNLTVNDRIHLLTKPYSISGIIQAIGLN